MVSTQLQGPKRWVTISRWLLVVAALTAEMEAQERPRAREEAIYNSLFRATPVTYRGRTIDALPVAETITLLDRCNARSGIGR